MTSPASIPSGLAAKVPAQPLADSGSRDLRGRFDAVRQRRGEFAALMTLKTGKLMTLKTGKQPAGARREPGHLPGAAPSGIKARGPGREGCGEGISEYLGTKYVALNS